MTRGFRFTRPAPSRARRAGSGRPWFGAELNTFNPANYATPAEAISGSIVVKTTGQIANAADEITGEMFVVELIPA